MKSAVILFLICFCLESTVVCLSSPVYESGERKTSYKILTQNVTINGEKEKRIFLQIYTKRNNFRVHKIVALFRNIRDRFGEYDQIAVALYDTKKIKESFPSGAPPQPYPLSGGVSPRGFFEYNKSKETAELSIGILEKKKIVEVEIVFNGNTYCVSRTKRKRYD